MGFDILLVGVILLANPFHTATDLIAAVILAVAIRRAEGMLRGFNKARLFSYALIFVGAIEIVFRYLFPLKIAMDIAEVWRWGLLIPIEIYLISGIMDFGMINENAEIYTSAERLKRPIYISFIAASCLKAASAIWPEINIVFIISAILAFVVTAMLAVVILRCYKETCGKKINENNEEENTENKS